MGIFRPTTQIAVLRDLQKRLVPSIKPESSRKLADRLIDVRVEWLRTLELHGADVAGTWEDAIGDDNLNWLAVSAELRPWTQLNFDK